MVIPQHQRICMCTTALLHLCFYWGCDKQLWIYNQLVTMIYFIFTTYFELLFNLLESSCLCYAAVPWQHTLLNKYIKNNLIKSIYWEHSYVIFILM